MARGLAGRIVAITGGGRGIGAATAAALARAGARVAVGDLDVAAAGETTKRIGAGATPFELDVTDRAGFTTFLDEVERRIGPLDVLVNNAGIMPLTRIEDEADAATERILAINLHAVIHGSREAIGRMKPRGTGHIVNVASVAAKVPFPGAATYAATKAGVFAFSEAIRAELRGTGVEVSCVLPGLVDTELARGIAAKGFKPITADDVARAVVGVLQRPRFEVYTPRVVGPAVRFGTIAGRRFSEWLQRTLKAETPMLGAIGSAERATYERRAGGEPR